MATCVTILALYNMLSRYIDVSIERMYLLNTVEFQHAHALLGPLLPQIQVCATYCRRESASYAYYATQYGREVCVCVYPKRSRLVRLLFLCHLAGSWRILPS